MATSRSSAFLLRTRARLLHLPPAGAAPTKQMESFLGRRDLRYFGDSAAAKSGRVLAEEERAAENVYIQKMEREKLEKLRRAAAKDRVETGKPGSSFPFVKEKKAQAEA